MAGIYSKIVSTTRQIDSIHTFINGARTDIKTGWVFVNGVRKQVFPSAETYTQVYSKTTGGNYSTTLGYGKYKIVISGGGGSGAIVARNSTKYVGITYNQNGYAGQQQTIYVSVPYGETKTISGVIGTGGTRAYARGEGTHSGATAGGGGTGYTSGNAGGSYNYSYYNSDALTYVSYGLASGGGGGSSRVLVDGVQKALCAGGNGGSVKVSARFPATLNGGTGASGGTTSGNGASGGAAATIYNSSGYSTAGTNGYIRIYQSSIFPN